MKTPVHRRHPAVTGAIGLAILVALIFGAFHIEDLPIIGGGVSYDAAFRDASGLTAGNEVRIAGVKVGKVTEGEPCARGQSGLRAGGLPHRRFRRAPR